MAKVQTQSIFQYQDISIKYSRDSKADEIKSKESQSINSFGNFSKKRKLNGQKKDLTPAIPNTNTNKASGNVVAAIDN